MLTCFRCLNTFIHLIVMVVPFFVLGIVVGALLESTVRFDFLYKFINKGKRSIVYASLLGALLPGCACATIPMAEGLRRRGAKMGSLASFMLTSPLLAPQTIVLTFGLLGFKFMMARVVFSVIGGIFIGFIFYWLSSSNLISMPHESDQQSSDTCCSSNDMTNHDQENLPSFFHSFFSITKKLSMYFFIGLLLAALLPVLVPIELIPNTIGDRPVIAYLLAAVVGIPVYVCEGEEIPLTYSFLALGLASGPAFTFMMGAVGTCIPTVLFAKQLLGKKALVIYLIFWSIFAPLSGYLFSMVR